MCLSHGESHCASIAAGTQRGRSIAAQLGAEMLLTQILHPGGPSWHERGAWGW